MTILRAQINPLAFMLIDLVGKNAGDPTADQVVDYLSDPEGNSGLQTFLERYRDITSVEAPSGRLEDVASTASPSYSPLPPELPHYGPIDEYESIFNRGYRSLAARAKHDPIALSQFKESSLQIKTDPAEARAILREHPLMKSGLVGSGKNEAVQFRVLNELRQSIGRLAHVTGPGPGCL